MFADRIKQKTTKTGTGAAFDISGSFAGMRSFAAAFADGDECSYCVEFGADYEIGVGTIADSGATLNRSAVMSSSNGGEAVDFAAGEKALFCVYAADFMPIVLSGQPTIDINPALVGTQAVDRSAGEVFICTDNSTDLNVWVGQLGSSVVPRLANTLSANAGGKHALAVISGDLFGWGFNATKGVNPASSSNPFTDTSTVLSSNVLMAAAGDNFSLVLNDNGDVVGWGNNVSGQTDPDLAADPTLTQDDVIVSGCKYISAGGDYGMAIKDNGDVVGWGSNLNKQVAPVGGATDGTVVIRGGAVKVDCGYQDVVCLLDDANVVGWGQNHHGQSCPTASDYNADVFDVTSVIIDDCIDIAAGAFHTLALKSNGDVYGWGSNQYYQIRPTDNTDVGVPTFIMGGCKAIGAGTNSSYLVKENGEMHAIGENGYGQTYPGGANPHTDPAQVVATGIDWVVGLQYGVVMQGEDGNYRGYGRNNYRQSHPDAGTGDYTDTSSTYAVGV